MVKMNLEVLLQTVTKLLLKMGRGVGFWGVDS